MLTDAECIQRCLAGDQQAFGILVDRYRAAIVVFCTRHLCDLDEAESLAQEVFLQVFFSLHALREVEPWTPMFTLKWDGFGRMDPVNWFNVIVFGHPKPIAYRALELKVLHRAIAHAHSATPGYGLQGYDSWITALETKRIDLPGSVRAARILREARGQAADFLKQLVRRYPQAASSLTSAADAYGTVASYWEQYADLMQHEYTTEIDDNTQQAIALITNAHAQEGIAIDFLQKAVAVIAA